MPRGPLRRDRGSPSYRALQRRARAHLPRGRPRTRPSRLPRTSDTSHQLLLHAERDKGRVHLLSPRNRPRAPTRRRLDEGRKLLGESFLLRAVGVPLDPGAVRRKRLPVVKDERGALAEDLEPFLVELPRALRRVDERRNAAVLVPDR